MAQKQESKGNLERKREGTRRAEGVWVHGEKEKQGNS